MSIRKRKTSNYFNHIAKIHTKSYSLCIVVVVPPIANRVCWKIVLIAGGIDIWPEIRIEKLNEIPDKFEWMVFNLRVKGYAKNIFGLLLSMRAPIIVGIVFFGLKLSFIST